jgi:hypothetical protein
MTALSANTLTASVLEIFRPCDLARKDMAFRDFKFPQVQQDLGLTVNDADLFATASPFPVREDFAAFVRDGVALAIANGTEKARSGGLLRPCCSNCGGP